jgi:hypothetical protein
MSPDKSSIPMPRAIPLAFAFAAVFLASTANAASGSDAWDGNWHGSFGIYGWLPGIDAELGVPVDTGTAVSKSNNDILDNLRGALMINGDFRKGEWGFFYDADWVKFENQKGRFGSIGGGNIGASGTLDTEWNFKGGLVTLAGLYTLWNGPDGYTDVVFGGRYLWVKTNIEWDFTLTGNGGNVGISDQGHFSSNTHYSNAIIGLRGRWQSTGSGWYVPYYADVGTGDSDVTSIIDAGVGYAFGWGDLALDWRWVHYDQGDDELVRNVDLSGPSLSLTWRF